MLSPLVIPTEPPTLDSLTPPFKAKVPVGVSAMRPPAVEPMEIDPTSSDTLDFPVAIV
ncbi:hypothetical protein B484DRAFT_444429, partial [Ochromonadaceae sp. CCMP2298]